MFNHIHQKLGTAGFIISIVALVAALGGGAYAASGGLSSKQKKEVEKIAKKYAGKPGAAGATGPAGPAGTAGGKGDPGSPGANGTGTAGTNGKSVTVGTATVAECSAGGATVEVEGTPASKKHICNGTSGSGGGGGLPETLGEETETGVIGFDDASGATEGSFFAPISFTVKLAAPLDESHAHFVTAAQQTAHSVPQCQGTVEAPTATEGNLCIYEGSFEPGSLTIVNTGIVPPGGNATAPGAGTAGAVFRVHFEGGTGEPNEIQGSWAVTG